MLTILGRVLSERLSDGTGGAVLVDDRVLTSVPFSLALMTSFSAASALYTFYSHFYLSGGFATNGLRDTSTPTASTFGSSVDGELELEA